MRKTLMTLVTLAGVSAFATASQAGDVAAEKAAAHADGGCGFSQAYLQAQAEDAKAQDLADTRAKLKALIDRALETPETASAITPIPKTGG